MLYNIIEKFFLFIIVLIISFAVAQYIVFYYPISFGNPDEYYSMFSEYIQSNFLFPLKNMIFGSSLYMFPMLFFYVFFSHFFANRILIEIFTRLSDFTLIILCFEALYYLFLKHYKGFFTLLPLRILIYIFSFFYAIWPYNTMGQIMASHIDPLSTGLLFILIFFWAWKKNYLTKPYVLILLLIYLFLIELNDLIFSITIVLPLIITLFIYLFFVEEKSYYFRNKIKRLFYLQNNMYALIFMMIIISLFAYCILRFFFIFNYSFSEANFAGIKWVYFEYLLLFATWLNLFVAYYLQRLLKIFPTKLLWYLLFVNIAFFINVIEIIVIARDWKIHYLWQNNMLTIISLFLPWVYLVLHYFDKILKKRIYLYSSVLVSLILSLIFVINIQMKGSFYQYLVNKKHLNTFSVMRVAKDVIACMPKNKAIFMATWYQAAPIITSVSNGRIHVMPMILHTTQQSNYQYSRPPFGLLFGATPHYFLVYKLNYEYEVKDRLLAFLGRPNKIYDCNSINVWYYKPRKNLHQQFYRMFVGAHGTLQFRTAQPRMTYIDYSTVFGIDGNNMLSFAIPTQKISSYRDYPSPHLTILPKTIGKVIDLYMDMTLFKGMYEIEITIENLTRKNIIKNFQFSGFHDFQLKITPLPNHRAILVKLYGKVTDLNHNLSFKMIEMSRLNKTYTITNLNVKRITKRHFFNLFKILKVDKIFGNYQIVHNEKKSHSIEVNVLKNAFGKVCDVYFKKIQPGKYQGVFIVKGLTVNEIKKALRIKSHITSYYSRTWFDKLFRRHITHTIQNKITLSKLRNGNIKLIMSYVQKERNSVNLQLFSKEKHHAFTIINTYLIKQNS